MASLLPASTTCSLEEPFELCASADRASRILGISQHSDRACLLVTFQGIGVSVYNIHDQKCTQTWSVRLSTEFTTPAIQHPASHHLAAIRDQRTLILWQESATDIERAPLASIVVDATKSRSAAKLVALRINGSAESTFVCAIAFTDGTLTFFSYDNKAAKRLNTTAAPVPNAVLRDVWASGSTLFALLDQPATPSGSSDRQLVVYEYTLDTATSTFVQRAFFVLEAPSNHASTATALARTGSLDIASRTLSVLWGDGSLAIYNLAGAAENARAPSLVRKQLLYQPASSSSSSSASKEAASLHTPSKGKGSKPAPKAASSENDTLSVSLFTFDSYVVLAGPSTYLSMHAPQPSKTVQCVVSVWDTRFGTLQGLTALASQSDANSSSDSLLALTATTGAPACNVYSVLRNSSDASLFALALDRRVLVCPIVTEPLSLASAIGRMTITSAYVEQSEQADADDAAGSDASLLPPIATTVSAPIVRSALTPAQWEAEIDADDAKELDFIARLSTPQQTPTLQSFTTAFNEYCQSREQQLRHQERRPSKRASSNGDADYDYTAEDLEAGSADAMDTSSGAGGLMNDDMDELHPRLALAGGSFFMHRFMSAVLHRIMSETAFFASAPLALMLKSGCVSVTLVPTLLRRLTDMIPAREGFIRPATPNKQASIPPLQALRLLELVLLHVHDLSETALVSLLRFFLEEADESVLLAYAAEKVDRKGLQFAASVKHVIDLFLFLIISAPRNDIYMQQELRSLGHNLVVILLKFLNRWIGRYGKHGEARLHSKTLAPRTPTFAQLLDWVALILDSHFTRVVFAQDTHNLVADLAATIQQHTQLCERMQDMKGHLFQLAAHGRLPKQPSSALYSIELVDF